MQSGKKFSGFLIFYTSLGEVCHVDYLDTTVGSSCSLRSTVDACRLGLAALPFLTMMVQVQVF